MKYKFNYYNYLSKINHYGIKNIVAYNYEIYDESCRSVFSLDDYYFFNFNYLTKDGL